MFEKKKSLFYILEILKEYTDESHFLTQKEIGEKLKSIYYIDVERKTIALSLELLLDCGYDINKNPKGGYYLGERELNENEIQYIIDAIYSSRSITGGQAKSISKKLYSILSKYQQKDYSYIHKSDEINRTDNSQIFLNIELINEAIENNKKISFNYLEYDELGNLIERKHGYRYTVSPYFLINNFSNYYLLSNIEKFNKHTTFKIDLMKDVKLEDEPIKPYSEVADLGKDFSIPKYINEHVYIFGGNVDIFEIELLDRWAKHYVFDWFRNQAKITKKEDKIIAKIKSDDIAFFYWALQYQDHIKVLSPSYMVEKIKNSLKNNLEKYI